MKNWPRVAFFTDSFHGVDGVATTSRNIVGAARACGLPLLSVRVGEHNRSWEEGSTSVLEFQQGPLSFAVDRHIRFDLLFMRHFPAVRDALRRFRADVVHITSPGEMGIAGAWVADDLRLPLVASWHTNIHEFAARRLLKAAWPLPDRQRRGLANFAEKNILRAVLRFYQIAQVMLAPNEELVKMLRLGTGKETFLMKRGTDRQLFSASKRDVRDGVFRLGFVGRLRPEKNLRLFVELEAALRRHGLSNYRFLIVGEGSERAWLERKLMQADFTGELHGEFLARAYANMDLFVFPSETDTYGNVVNEALASGTPAVVTRHGGPKYLVENGVTGFVAADAADFIYKVKLLMTTPKLHAGLREGARGWSAGRSWTDILEELREAYEAGQSSCAISPPWKPTKVRAYGLQPRGQH